MRLLIIEDEIHTAYAIKKHFHHYYVIDVALSGKTGMHLAEVCDYDLIILDLLLPDIYGEEICRILRVNSIFTPILVLTGRIVMRDKVSTLDSGADDYLTKPFSFDELGARIRALVRRGSETKQTVLIVGNLSLDPIRRIVVRGRLIIQLRRKEFDLLEYMMRNKGKVLKRSTIMQHVWQNDDDMYSNIVDVHIKALRDKLDRTFDQKLIKTIYGVGYLFENIS